MPSSVVVVVELKTSKASESDWIRSISAAARFDAVSRLVDSSVSRVMPNIE